jgi:hypothetical protein
VQRSTFLGWGWLNVAQVTCTTFNPRCSRCFRILWVSYFRRL